MRFPFIKLLFKMVGTELLFKEAMRLFHRELNVIKEEIGKKLGKIIAKGLLWLLISTLLMIGCVFVLLALALYLNEVFYSSFKGLLIVGGGCILLVLIVVLIVTMRMSKHEVNVKKYE
jgi:hypothetical protein